KLRSRQNPVNQIPDAPMTPNIHIGGTVRRKIGWLVAWAIFVLSTNLGAAVGAEPRFSVLVFSKTTGFRHQSIPQGIPAIKALGAEHGFRVDPTEDAGHFTPAELAQYRVVVFLCTTGDILDPDQKAAFEGFISSGGGFAGIHSASDTE